MANTCGENLKRRKIETKKKRLLWLYFIRILFLLKALTILIMSLEYVYDFNFNLSKNTY